MHIPVPRLSDSDLSGLVDDLTHLIKQPSASKSPPCPNCAYHEKIGFESINCNYECDHAPEALSEDPVRYPIEEHVVPLVFELTCMRLVQTCWSCEGHLDIDGALWKIPQVSFYSARPIYSQLICNYLARLYWRKELNYPWDVVLTNYGRTWDVTYTIKCDMSRVAIPDIYLLQKDLLCMAENLSYNIKNDAKKLIDDIQHCKMSACASESD